MCGGSKLPPKSAISGIEQEPLALARERGPVRLPQGAELGDGGPLLRLRPERRAAGEQVDGRLVLDELVLLGPPAELRWILRARVHDGGDTEPDGVQPARVGDVDLHAVAALPLVLVPGGREGRGAEADPLESFASKIVGEPLRV